MVARPSLSTAYARTPRAPDAFSSAARCLSGLPASRNTSAAVIRASRAAVPLLLSASVTSWSPTPSILAVSIDSPEARLSARSGRGAGSDERVSAMAAVVDRWVRR